MADTNQTDKSQIFGNVLFYSKPEPLSKEAHANLGVRRIDKPYSFAAGSQVAPLTVAEFPAASLSFPVIFAGERYQPLAVMGVTDGANMFIQPDGAFEPGVYIPAYIRRYPFVLANYPQGEQLVVCIDRAAPMLGELPDMAFFDAAGEPTQYTKNCMSFCNDFEIEVRRTEAFLTLMRDLDLFESRTQTFTPVNPDGSPGVPQTVAEYFAISEAKLKALPPERLQELVANGAMNQIYAHLNSLLGWDRLVALAIFRQAQAPRAANLN